MTYLDMVSVLGDFNEITIIPFPVSKGSELNVTLRKYCEASGERRKIAAPLISLVMRWVHSFPTSLMYTYMALHNVDKRLFPQLC